jgi:chromosomal replication initiator protein
MKRDWLWGEPSQVKVIIHEVAEIHGVTPANITGPSRSRHIARARQHAVFLARAKTGKSYKTLGRIFGGRHHTTIIYAERMVKENRLLYPMIEVAE